MMGHSANSLNGLQRGLIAGAAGTVTLNIVTYSDMALRGRGSSSMPAKAAGKLAGAAGVQLGDDEQGSNRKQGLGALLGLATGLGTGVVYGMVGSRLRLPLPLAAVGLAGAAMAGSDVPMTALGLTDPRKWPALSWAMDIIPHLAYGVAAAAAYRAVSR